MRRASAVGDSIARDGFFFLGNHPALDFLNTRPIVDEQPQELLPDFPAVLRWLQAAGLMEARDAAKLKTGWGDSRRGQRVADDLRNLREDLRKDIQRLEQGRSSRPAFVEALNQKMKARPMRMRLRSVAGGFVTELYCLPSEPEDVLAPLLHSAADLLAKTDPSRLRQCANCVLHFYDSSKKGTRRWCSMQLCGNRHKVAAYAERKRSEPSV